MPRNASTGGGGGGRGANGGGDGDGGGGGGVPGNGGGSEGGGGNGGGLRTTHEPSSTVAAESKLYACGAIHPAIPGSSRPMPGAALLSKLKSDVPRQTARTVQAVTEFVATRDVYAPLRWRRYGAGATVAR